MPNLPLEPYFIVVWLVYKNMSYVDGLGRMFSVLLNEISYKSRFPIQRVMGTVSFRQSKLFCSEISTRIIFFICR